MDEEKEDMAQFIESFVAEADDGRRAHIQRADKNNSQYLGDYGDDVSSKFGHSNFVLNKTQPAIIAHTQIQIEQRPRVQMSARESGRTDELWVSRKALTTIRVLMQNGTIESYEENEPGDELASAAESLESPVDGMMDGGIQPAVKPPVDIETDTQGFVFELLDQSDAKSFEVTEAFIARILPFAGEWQGLDGVIYSPAIKESDIIVVTDKIGSEIIGNNCDILWDMGDNDSWLFENIHNNNIIGWQFALYQWDAEDGRDLVFNLHPKHVWLAAEATSIEDSEGVVIKEPMSKATAMQRYPEIIKEIKEYGGDNLAATDMGSSDIAAVFRDTKFSRKMVNVWTGWFRNHRYPLSPDDAIDRGLVVLDDGAFYLAGDDGESSGESTTPGTKNWPQRKGVRQVKVVCGKVVEDMECPYWDIPVIQNKNIPVPFRWIAIGEPQRLEWIDRLINKTCSIVFDTIKYGRSQQEIYPDEIWEGLKEQRSKMHSHPARQMHIRGDVYLKYQAQFASGKGFSIDPPRVPEAAIMFLREMFQLHDIISGNTAELQGRQSSAGLSGKAIENLQGAARGIIGFKATMTEHMLKRLIRLRVHAMTKRGWLTPRMWKKFNDKYPAEVLDAIRMRAKQIDLDIVVEVASGGGELRKVKQNQVRMDYEAQLIDGETALNELDYPDIKGILTRMEERRQAAMLGQATAAQQGAMNGTAAQPAGQPTPMAA